MKTETYKILPEPMHIGEFIEWQLELLDLSLWELSKKTNIDIKTLRNIVHKKSDIDMNIASKLEKVFGLPADGFLKLQESYYKQLSKYPK